MIVQGTHVTVTISDDPTLALIGWVAAKRGDQFVVVVSSSLKPWQQAVACLEAVTDSEYDAYAASLPVEEQVRREAERTFGMTARESLIAKRTALGRASQYEQFVKSLPIPEQRRREPVEGGWATRIPAFA